MENNNIVNDIERIVKENKVQAIAILAALLFGASLALFPLPEEEHETCCGPEDYTQVECD